ncbi:hypothetical protein SFRURICE_014842 [Spodoptera frugiperda]|nr:hypothetical protein SFRURICE_014842 [Spodoptera frugiperda]
MTALQEEETSSQCRSLFQRHSGRRESRDDLQPPFTITCFFRTFFILSRFLLIGKHSLAQVETELAKLYFLYGKMRAMDGFPTIDTSHTRAALLLHIAT